MKWSATLLKRMAFPILGLGALVWFLVRVIPKPSRAIYPCQRAAFPIATSFIIWLTGVIASRLAILRATKLFGQSRNLYAFSLLFIGILIFISSVIWVPVKVSSAMEPVMPFGKGVSLPAIPVVKDEISEPVINPAARVSVIQSGRSEAGQITLDEILSMVRTAVEDAGGLEGICGNGDLVVLKPNLVSLPETWMNEYVEVNGKTTDWRVTRAVAMLIREINPEGKIYILEGSAMQSTREIMDKLNYDTLHIPEVDGILCLEEESGAYRDQQSESLVGVFLEPRLRKYPLEQMPDKALVYFLNKLYKEADVLISIPVLKNHEAASVSGSIKNVGIGATPQNMYGNGPTELGRWNIISHDPADLHKWIHDYYLCRPVDFVVVDGLQGMENGPTEREYQTGKNLREVQKNMRMILAGKDPVATDAIAALLMCQDPMLVNHLVYLNNSGMGTIDPARIQVKGKPVHSVRKVFSHWSAVTLGTMFSDLVSPEFEVRSFSNPEGDLWISLSVGSDVVKVEIAVNGQTLDLIVQDGYDNISLDLDTLYDIKGKDVIIHAYDRFLNCSSRTAGNIEVTGLEDPEGIGEFHLAQNYPNPFYGSTTIPFHLNSAGHVRLKVLDAAGGRECAILIDQYLHPGQHAAKWDPVSLQQGVYIYCLEFEGRMLSRRMVLK